MGHFQDQKYYDSHGRDRILSFPEGPKIEKIQDFAPGLKLSSDQSQIEIFNRDWNFQARLKIRLLLWGFVKVGIEIFKRDWNFQSRLKFSILDWNFQAYGLKISRDQSGLNFFNRRALWVFSAPGNRAIFSTFGAISLLYYTVNQGKNPLEKIQKIQWRRRPEIADFCPLSWSNVSWYFRHCRTKKRRDCQVVWMQNGQLVLLVWMPPKDLKWFCLGIYSKKRESDCLWLWNQEAAQNGEHVQGFWVRTPICEMVPTILADMLTK